MTMLGRALTLQRLALGAAVLLAGGAPARAAHPLAASSRRSVAAAVDALDSTAGARMRAALHAAAIPARPERLWLVGFKDTRRLELWAERAPGHRVRVASWPVLAASGTAGPKLRQGDLQVPEGVYPLEALNPHSAFHLSLRIGYPSAADRAWAARDRRTRLGGDIYIHGKDVSIGCLAIGDEAIEELFWLAGRVGPRAFTVLLVPTDLRRNPAPRVESVRWAEELYRGLKAELDRFPD